MIGGALANLKPASAGRPLRPAGRERLSGNWPAAAGNGRPARYASSSPMPPAAPPTPGPAEAARNARLLANGFAALVGVTFCLIVLGALVRANDAGLACPDWPLCFGEAIPRMNVEVAFEWSHRVLAGGVSVCFAALALLTLRQPATRRRCRRLLVVGAALLGVQVLLGALTVWQLLASWTVTSHLITGNAFAVALLWTALALRELATPDSAPAARPGPALRRAVLLAMSLLALQMVLGGLVSSRYAGLVCPEWPTCNGGLWFPTFRGPVGLHLLHRLNGYALAAALLATAALGRRDDGPLRGLTLIAAALVVVQVAVGVGNVLLALPVEVTGLHSALAAALVLTLAAAVREVLRHDKPTPAVLHPSP